MSGATPTLIHLAALCLLAAGCQPAEPPRAPEAPSSPAENTDDADAPSKRIRLGAIVPIDAKELRTFRLDACYYGAVGLRAARDLYLASLGQSPPAAGKLPRFPQNAARVEQSARLCTSAAGSPDPASPAVDAALKALAPIATALAADLVGASRYYETRAHEHDALARGRELHGKIVESGKRLDDPLDRLGAALAASRKATPEQGADEGARLATAAIADARAALDTLAAPRVDPAAHRAAVERVKRSVGGLRTFGSAHPEAAWSAQLVPPLDAFIAAAEAAKLAGSRADGDSLWSVAAAFEPVIDARTRASSGAQKP